MVAPLVAALISAAPYIIQGASSIIGHNTGAGRMQKKLIKDEMNAYENGRLGWTAAQRRRAIAEAMRQARAAASADRDQLGRVQAAMGYGRSGATAALQRDIARGVQQAGADAALQADALSAQQALQRYQNLQAMLANRQQGNYATATNVGANAAAAAQQGYGSYMQQRDANYQQRLNALLGDTGYQGTRSGGPMVDVDGPYKDPRAYNAYARANGGVTA